MKNYNMGANRKSEKPTNNIFHINKELLPFKLHFFFIYGGFAGVMPFMQLIAKQLGINSAAVGIGYSAIPIFVFLSNPIFGFVVDYFQNIKAFLIVLLVASSTAFASVLTLPTIIYERTRDVEYAQIFGFNSSENVLNISTPFEKSCLNKVFQKDVQCEIGIEYTNFTDKNMTLLSKISLSVAHYVNESIAGSTSGHLIQGMTFYIQDHGWSELNDTSGSTKSFQCSPTIDHCIVSLDTENSVFAAYQYWVFFALVVIGGVTSASVFSLSSVASYEILGTRAEVYGRQRLFGTISWGLVCPLAGFLNDKMSSATEKSFTSGFYIMAVFMIIDIIIICVIYIPKAKISSNISRDLGKIFTSKEILLLAFGVTLVGVFQSIISVYEFWYLEDMGANRTLLGLAVASQCLLGEVLFLFYAGWFVKKLGHLLCFALVFAAFTLRQLLYSVIQNPWLVIPVDILHGITYGVYHGATTSFAKLKAPKGMEATMLGFFGGLSEGLGYGIGSFVGGFGLDKLGARKTYFSASMVSFGCLLLFLGASYVSRSKKEKILSHVSPSEMDEMDDLHQIKSPTN